MNVTIVGAGNMGLAMLGYIAAKGKADVTLYTSSQKLQGKSIQVRDLEGAWESPVSKFCVTSSLDAAFGHADLVLCTYPAFLRQNFIATVKDYLPKGSMLGFIPGYGGAEFYCRELIERGVTVFALQRVPYVARHRQLEDHVEAGILSKKNRLFAAAIPSSRSADAAAVMENLLDIPTTVLSEYLSITLAPSNPLLHIAGLYNVFQNYELGQTFTSPLGFYAEWNDATSELLLEYDRELQNICKALKPLDLCEVVPLPIYYESPTAQAMTAKLKSIESFKAVQVPLKQTSEGTYLPDLDSRMFVEDFPFGVCMIKAFGLLAGKPTPVVDMLLEFYRKLSGFEYFTMDGSWGKDIHKTAIPQLFGLNTKEDIINYYHRKD